MHTGPEALLKQLQRIDALAELFNGGNTPESIKAWVITTLLPYYENEDVLESLAMEILVPEAIRLTRLKQNTWAFKEFTQILATYHQSKQTCSTTCFKIFNENRLETNRALSKFWSVHNSQDFDTNSSLEDRAFRIFQLIGALIEGCIQPLFRELLQHVRSVRRKRCEFATTSKLKFGNVVSELFDTSHHKSICEQPPWFIRTNQWRNISQHTSFHCRHNQIELTYGEASSPKTLLLSEEQLVATARGFSDIFSALEGARSAIIVSNLDQFKLPLQDESIRDETSILHLQCAIVMQGFSLVALTHTQEQVRAKISDFKGGDPLKRLVHASQFLYSVWFHIPRPKIFIEYQSYDDGIKHLLCCDSDVLVEISSGRQPFEYLNGRFTVEAV